MIRTWRGTIGLAMLTAPGYAAALAMLGSVWSQALVGACAYAGFFLLTTGGDRK